MTDDHSNSSQEFYLHYKTASVILGIYKHNDIVSQIILENRKGAKSGCELSTEINGISLRLYSGLLRGCLYKLALELPLESLITIPHVVFIDRDGHISQLIINEEIYCRVIQDIDDVTDMNRQVFTALDCKFKGKEIRTKPYDFDDVDVALREIKDIASEEKNITIHICPNCQFIDYYANTMICLRDLNPSEYVVVREMRKRRNVINNYYNKIAWDIDDFHYCSAFSARDYES